MNDPDLVVVGGGIAGGTFATVMARAGANVLVLERQAEYRDRVRGELMWPWGVAEVQRLGLEDVFRRAGANVADRFESHEEGTAAETPVVQADLSAEVAGAPGSINLFHPSPRAPSLTPPQPPAHGWCTVRTRRRSRRHHPRWRGPTAMGGTRSAAA